MHIDLHSTVNRLHNTLDALETGSLRPDVVCARFRVASLQWPDLPERYENVLERLLQPLDMAITTGAAESCAYSQSTVIDGLRQWLNHAAALQQRH